MNMTKGTPASSQIVWLTTRVEQLERENSILRSELKERFAALVAAHEREACAWIADTYGGPKEPMMVGTYEAGWHNAAEAIAADIRARNKV